MGAPMESNGRDKEKKPVDWTIMLYIAADGALANFAVGGFRRGRRLPIACGRL